MNNTRWERMWELFHMGAELPEVERSSFLAVACEEELLRDEVAELLAAHEQLGEDPDETGSQPGAPAADPLLGTDLGAYRLLQRIGSGGMGVVYLAERIDGELEHRVAIKLLPPTSSGGEILQRFRQERQILASLAHPNIARLLDARTTRDGRPYLVMEFVEGRPIDRYCREEELSLEDRIRLVGAVCSAVHTTHQSLVIHRDLKPDNILVTASGEPKLLDFGVAKLLETDSGTAARLTAHGVRPMTPAYASPEQLRGEAVTTASDVYALGVLLYELLTGHHPWDDDQAPELALVRRLQSSRIQAPSIAVRRTEVSDGDRVASVPGISPRRLARSLRGDLDNIVLTALAEDPKRRYGSAQQLHDDLHRFLEGVPVQARKHTVAYRTRKFLRRHPWGSAAAATFLILLSSFAALMTLQSMRLEAERAESEERRAEAEREQQRAERISDFLVDIFAANFPSRAPGRTMTARELLDRGAAQISEQLENEPRVEAKLLSTLGRAYESLGLYRDASPLVERSVQLAREHAAGDGEIADTVWQLATLRQAQGRYGEAEELHREAIALRRNEFGDDAPAVADSLNAMAAALHQAGRYEQAESAYRESLAIRSAAFGDRSWQVSQVAMNLGWLLHDRSRFDEAEVLYQQALELNRELLGARHRWVAKALSNIALLHHDRGDLDVARDLYQEAWELDLRIFGGEQQHPDLAIHLHNQARLWNDLGSYERAEQLYLTALDIREQALEPGHAALGTSHNGLGRLHLDRGDALAAERHLRRALEIRRRALAPGNWHIAHTEALLGASLLEQGRAAEAEILLRTAVPIIEAHRGRRDLRAQHVRGFLDRIDGPREPDHG